MLSDSEAIARAIVECLSSLKLPFGVGYLADVLAGANLEKIRGRGHDQLPHYGALAPRERREVQALVLQLVEQGVLHRSGGDRPVLSVTQKGRALLDESAEVTLRAPEEAPRTEQGSEADAGDFDMGLFESLRQLRRAIADERSVPPFVVFGDLTLREMARLRPMTLDAFRAIKGVGERKLSDFGERFLEQISQHCHAEAGGGPSGRYSEAV